MHMCDMYCTYATRILCFCTHFVVHSLLVISGVPRIFFRGRGSTNSVEDRENGDLGAVAPLVRGSGDSCNLVQEISFHMVKFS